MPQGDIPVVCGLLEAQITAGFSWSRDSSLGRSSLPQAPATPLARAGFYLACLVAPPSCPKSPARCRYSLVCGFLLGKGARFWLGASDEKQAGYQRPRLLHCLLLKHGNGRRNVPLCHRLQAEGACGAWQGQRSFLKSRGVPEFPAPGSAAMLALQKRGRSLPHECPVPSFGAAVGLLRSAVQALPAAAGRRRALSR